MIIGFLVGSKNFCELLSVPCEVFVLHEHDWIHWVAKSCTTVLASRLTSFTEDFMICCDHVTKISARGTTSPVRLLQEAIVILVLWQISQFRFFGKGVETLCLPGTTRLCAPKRVHEKNSRVSLFESLQPMRYFGKWQVAPYLLMVHISKGFRFWVGLNDGWPRACSSALSHSTDSGIGVEPLLLSCCDDVGGVVPYEFDEEEVVDKPETTIGT